MKNNIMTSRISFGVIMLIGLLLTESLAQQGRRRGPRKRLPNFHVLQKHMDLDQDKKISKQEYTGPDDRFDELDKNGDGFLTEDEFAPPPNRRRGGDDGAPKVGEEAPTFALKSFDGKSEYDLSDYRGKKPVVLFFGSYT